MTSDGLRVGLVSYDFYPPLGGQGVYVYEVARRLPQYGVEPVVFCPRSGNGPVIPLGGGNPLTFSYRVNRTLPSLVRRHRIDVVHAQGGPGGVLLLRSPGLPMMYTVHHLYSRQMLVLRASGLRAMAYQFLRALEPRGYQLARRIIAVSELTHRSVVEDYGIPEGRITVIPNGVDTEHFRPLPVPKVPHSILYVGRLHPRKGLRYLVQAMLAVRDRIADAQLILIGEGRMRAELERQVRELGLERAVTFVGGQNWEELSTWYNRAAVFVLPSLFETFGIVCLEALACGTPVIVSSGAGVAAELEAEGVARCVPPASPDALAAAMGALLDDEAEGKSLGLRGREIMVERYSWERITERVAQLYRSVV